MPAAPSERRTLLSHVARRLADFGDLGVQDLVLVEQLDGDTFNFLRGAEITAAAAAVPQFVLHGWACQMRPHPTRRRQIFGFLLPGDVIGSVWRPPEFSFCKTVALTQLTTLSAERLTVEASETLRHAARRAEEHAQHRLYDHIVRLGARDAYGGLAHLLLEFHARLSAVGLSEGDDFLMPIGQRVLAQAMGFSVAHTNHTLQRMSADGLLCIHGERVRLLKPERLVALADLSNAGGPRGFPTRVETRAMSQRELCLAHQET